MNREALTMLLHQIRDGDIGVELCDQVRAGLAAHPLGDALPVGELFRDDPEGEAELVLDMLVDRPGRGLLAEALEAELRQQGDPIVSGVMASILEIAEPLEHVAASVAEEAGASPELSEAHDPAALPVGAAVVHEAGPAPELAASHDATALPVAAAVHAESGRPELAAAFDPEALPVSEAVVMEAGVAPEVARGFDDAAVPLSAAVQFEQGRMPDLAAAFDAEALPVAEAVREESGSVDLVARVLAEVRPEAEVPEGAWISALLDRELPMDEHLEASERLVANAAAGRQLAAYADLGRRLREQITAEAGQVDSLWHGVASGIGIADPEAVPGWDAQVLAEAVRFEQGSAPDLTDAVLALVARDARVLAPYEEPEAVNQTSWPAVVAFAAVAAALLLVLGPGLVGSSDDGDEWTARPVEFAVAGEINVDELAYGPNTSIFVEVPTNSETPLIIWVDDGTSL